MVLVFVHMSTPKNVRLKSHSCRKGPQLRARMCGPGSRVSHYAMHVFNLLGVNSQYHRRPTHHQPSGFGRDPHLGGTLMRAGTATWKQTQFFR